ncbi:acyl-CoA dehydrogenase family protein [Hyalangium versicolor]|uniref:acyl-CoA dehydrogenase family protein n=1 Tax=Hyalangium versicolor TaxID=2861190 RepID=UPI001CCA8079|nr:acyl-CoA dehydrogenase family protein [Hyalangium versicolor]
MKESELQLISAVRELSRTRFAGRAAQFDQERRFPQENIAELKRLGLPGMVVPSHLGGLDISVEAQVRIMEEIGYGDPSTATILGMHCHTVAAVVQLPPASFRSAAIDEICRAGAMLCGGNAVPLAELDGRRSGYRAEDRGDHFVLSGRAGFATGSEGATYALVVARLSQGAGAAAARPTDIVFTLVPAGTRGLEIHRNWNGMGLRATATHDIELVDVCIPKAQALCVPVADVQRWRESVEQGPPSLESQRQLRNVMGLLGSWLGLSQAVMDFTVGFLGARYGKSAGAPASGFQGVADQAHIHMALGRAEHWVETGRIVLYDTVSRLETPFTSKTSLDLQVARTLYHLRRMCEEVSNACMQLCGAHGYSAVHPLERMLRDLAGYIVMRWKTDELVAALGRGALGRPIALHGLLGT